jgi:hypothetical protein
VCHTTIDRSKSKLNAKKEKCACYQNANENNGNTAKSKYKNIIYV